MNACSTPSSPCPFCRRFTSFVALFCTPTFRKIARLSLGIILFFLTLHAALRGMNWDVGVHPDEIAISRFQHTISQTGYLTHRAYPTGWFRLYGIKESIRRPWNTHVESFKKKHLAQDDHYRPQPPHPSSTISFRMAAPSMACFLPSRVSSSMQPSCKHTSIHSPLLQAPPS